MNLTYTQGFAKLAGYVEPRPQLGLTHHFVGDGYAKVTVIEPGTCVPQHAHKFDHDSLLMLGKALVEVDGVATEYEAPITLKIEAHKAHKVTALTPVLWACIWENPEGICHADEFDHTVIE